MTHRLSRGPVLAGSYQLPGGGRLMDGAGAPVNGTTGANLAGPGSIYFDTTNANSWINVGTKASPVWSPQGAVAVALTSANILAMNGAPVAIVAAPPTGYAVIVRWILFTMTRTATQYTSGGAVSFVYHGGSTAVHEGSIPATVVTGAAGTVLTKLGGSAGSNGTTVPTATGVDVTNASAAFATGTGTAVVRVAYDVVKQAA